MATFNQQNQTVQKQYNAETIHFDSAKTADDFLLQLKKLQVELDKAIEAKALSAENAIDAKAKITQAAFQVAKGSPDKKTLVEHLSSAKKLVSSVSGLAETITGAITAVGTLFQ